MQAQGVPALRSKGWIDEGEAAVGNYWDADAPPNAEPSECWAVAKW